MKPRNPLLLLLLVTSALAAFPSLHGIAIGWTPGNSLSTTADAASDDEVATAAFALG